MTTRFSILLFSVLAIGCKTDTEGLGSCSSPGSEGCACTAEGLCLGGLTCASDICVDLGAMSTTGDDSDSSTTSTTSTSDDSKGSDPSTTSTTSTTDPSTSSTTTGEPPPMKPDLGGVGCTPGSYGCDCDCSSGLFCECDAPFVCQGADNICGIEECLQQYEPCQGLAADCCGDAQCLGLEDQDDFACVGPCTTDADCPVTCCVNTSFDEFFCAPSNYYC